MTWQRNVDGALVLRDGKRMACIYAVGLGIYPKPYKAVVYGTGFGSGHGAYRLYSMHESVSKAKHSAELAIRMVDNLKQEPST